MYVVGAQLLTVSLFNDFLPNSLNTPSNQSWIIWVIFVICMTAYVLSSAGFLSFAWRSETPKNRSLQLLSTLIVAYIVSWAVLVSHAIRTGSAFTLEQIGWTLALPLIFSSVIPLTGRLGMLAVSQSTAQCGIILWLQLVAVDDNSTMSSSLTGLLLLTCIVSHLGVARANQRLALTQRIKENDFQRRIFEDQLKNLQKTHIYKANLIAMMSHDLRQPIQALDLMLERLKQTTPQLTDHLEAHAINDVTRSLTRSLEMLVAVTRLTSGQLVPLPETITLKRFFTSLSHEFKETANRQSLCLSFDHGGINVVADPYFLHTILSNLISNSIKYSKAGTIWIRATNIAKQTVRIEVEDEGVGIAKYDLQKIFEPFVRLQLRSTEDEGTGLGLAIVKQMADLIQAPLNITSTVGCGSKFSIDLPRAESNTDHDGTSLDINFQGLHVVVVDNDHVVLDSVTRNLAEWGCQIIAAHDWSELKVRLDKSVDSVDLVLSDFHLDGRVSGRDIIERLRQRQKRPIPGILFTGDVNIHPAPDDPPQSPVIAYKPISSKRLAMLIYEALATRQPEAKKEPST